MHSLAPFCQWATWYRRLARNWMTHQFSLLMDSKIIRLEFAHTPNGLTANVVRILNSVPANINHDAIRYYIVATRALHKQLCFSLLVHTYSFTRTLHVASQNPQAHDLHRFQLNWKQRRRRTLGKGVKEKKSAASQFQSKERMFEMKNKK